jgi:hypothetical protein
MYIGKIVSIEDKIAKVQLSTTEFAYFNVTHQSVVHGRRFALGEEVSVRFSRNNLRVESVVPADY